MEDTIVGKKYRQIIPIKAIRVVSCGKDWVSDTDTTLPVEKIRGFSFDDWGVHLYSVEKDIHGEYDNVNVPYSNLSAVVFHFYKAEWQVKPIEDIPIEYFESGGK